MSRDVAALVYSRQVGSMARKAVLAYFAERANDDGSGIWSSKQRIADEIECSKQTVITTIKALIADGLLREAGIRQNRNGHTIEYDIVLEAVIALPEARRSDQGVQILTGPELDRSNNHPPRGQTALPKPSLNRPIPQKASPSSGEGAKRVTSRKSRLAEDWHPQPIDPDSVCGRIIAEWPRGRVEEELARFKDHHLGRGSAMADWQAAWRTWVQNAKRFERDGTTESPWIVGLRQAERRDRPSGPIESRRRYRSSNGLLDAVMEVERTASGCSVIQGGNPFDVVIEHDSPPECCVGAVPSNPRGRK
jgi:hypothetical protein